MTVAPERPSLTFSTIEEVARELRRLGGRLSAARRGVLEALFAAEGPVSADFIASGLGGRVATADLATVYRNLERLEELGVVRHVHLGHGPGLYALAGQGDREYLACERCGRVTSVEPAALDGVRRSIERRFGYRAHFAHFPIVGLCEACAGTQPADGESRSEQEHSHRDYVHSHPHAAEHRHGDSGG